MLEILEIWFTPSGAAVTLLLVLLILFLCAFFVPSAQALIGQFLEKGVRGKWGSGQIEFGGSVPSKPAYGLPAGEATPTPPMEPDSQELQTSEIRSTKVEGEDPNSESSLRIDMQIASWSRDHEALEKAYNALKILPGRKQSDESLITEKLSLEHRMGDESAVGRLARLADANPDWYEPRQSLASIYYNLAWISQTLSERSLPGAAGAKAERAGDRRRVEAADGEFSDERKRTPKAGVYRVWLDAQKAARLR